MLHKHTMASEIDLREHWPTMYVMHGTSCNQLENVFNYWGRFLTLSFCFLCSSNRVACPLRWGHIYSLGTDVSFSYLHLPHIKQLHSGRCSANASAPASATPPHHPCPTPRQTIKGCASNLKTLMMENLIVFFLGENCNVLSHSDSRCRS